MSLAYAIAEAERLLEITAVKVTEGMHHYHPYVEARQTLMNVIEHLEDLRDQDANYEDKRNFRLKKDVVSHLEEVEKQLALSDEKCEQFITSYEVAEDMVKALIDAGVATRDIGLFKKHKSSKDTLIKRIEHDAENFRKSLL